MQICFVTCGAEALLTPDDGLLVNYLSSKNIKVSAAIWDDDQIDWLKYDAIILRSMWDYHTQPDKFNLWLDRLESLNCTVYNPVSVVKENLNKKYLADFYKAGILLPPLEFCAHKTTNSLTAILQANSWDKAVVKPAISGGSYNTWITNLPVSQQDELHFAEMLLSGDVIVQKFVNEIITGGELSLIFFNKKFSHAILKRAKQGDFRVQLKFGGTAEAIQPDEEVLNAAMAILNLVDEPLLYARVDGVLLNNEFYLMELELIEPALSIASNTMACENFYRALSELLPLNDEFKISKNQVDSHLR